jgi:hypothetical protein
MAKKQLWNPDRDMLIDKIERLAGIEQGYTGNCRIDFKHDGRLYYAAHNEMLRSCYAEIIELEPISHKVLYLFDMSNELCSDDEPREATIKNIVSLQSGIYNGNEFPLDSHKIADEIFDIDKPITEPIFVSKQYARLYRIVQDQEQKDMSSVSITGPDILSLLFEKRLHLNQ